MRLSIFSRFLMIFALLFAQTGSLTHGITHIVTKPAHTSDHSLPHDKHCDQCAAYAQLGAALGSHAIHIKLPEQRSELVDTTFTPLHATAAFTAFAARAPPYSA